jgi:hypothetical protein
MPRRQQRKHTRSDLIASLKGSGVRGPLSKMTKAQLQKMHADRTEVATDQEQTLSVTSGSASTNLPLGGSGTSSISLEGRGMKLSGSGMRVSGSGHCSGGGKQGSGKFQQLVRKHKGDMKAASREYKQQKGSGLTDVLKNVAEVAAPGLMMGAPGVAAGMLLQNPKKLLGSGEDMFGAGQPLAVEQFLEEGGSDQDGGSLSEYLDKVAKVSGAVAAGAAFIPGVGEVVAPVAGTLSTLTKAGSFVAGLTGNGDLDVTQYME